MSGLWLGNQEISGDIFNELYTKIKITLAFWKGRNLSLIGRVKVINIYILSRLWYRTEIFSVPKNLPTEIERDILDFVWNKKKQGINKQLLMSCESNGGLQKVDIQSKIGAQHLSWLAKVLKLHYDDFNRKIADEILGIFKGYYIGLEVFRADADMLKPKVVDQFHKETMYVWEKLPRKYVESGVKSTGNPWIVNEDGEVLTLPMQLINLGIYRVKDLKFKRGTRDYNQQVLQQIKVIKGRNPTSSEDNTIESDLIQIRTDKEYRDVSNLTSRDLYVIQRNSLTINKPYIEKRNKIFPNENFHWNHIWWVGTAG